MKNIENKTKKGKAPWFHKETILRKRHSQAAPPQLKLKGL